MGLGHTLMDAYVFDEAGRIGPRRDRLPDPDEHGPAAPDGERRDRERGRPRSVRREGHERGALLPVTPAVAAAVHAATGAVIRDLPLTPERVWRALREQADGA